VIKISTFTHKLKLVTPTRLNKKEFLDFYEKILFDKGDDMPLMRGEN